ncbi:MULTISPECIES: AI-2E family transporter [Paenibacillus]|uniref:AI-2E family transporter n=1 Tax=Paenibacillus campinasensis TaxID=66347 RepID=A0A268F5A2_9BACL|nr:MULTISPECIES: AI-2E family transporter [Paenibacillus]MUG64432.1 AI-2E family transporter [Paenibacillus campinasensis]PAD80556.1 AI-2E family transporter [Paenibacillus campinasensis]PAK55154.1 AI-2E family transporter [Paenibacillus sp. 7541]
MEQLTGSKWFRFMIWLLIGLISLYFVWLLRPMFMDIYRFLKAILAPFAVAMIISYVLNPIVCMLSERKVPRSIAVLLIYAVFLTLLAVVLINMIPMLIRQLEELSEHLPEISMNAQTLMTNLDSRLIPPGVRTGVNSWFFQMENRLAQGISTFLNNIGDTISVLFNVMIIPFLIFYILKDFDVFQRTVVAYLPRGHRRAIVTLLKEIDTALGNYIRGQFLVCLIIGILAYIGYMLIGMPYALLLASIVAIFNIIPYLGPFLGAAPALIMASTISWRMVLMVAIVNMICQTLESNVISPQVVGRKLHLHPILIIFALLVGGQLAGTIGLILAVPVLAALKVLLQHVFAYYVRRKSA